MGEDRSARTGPTAQAWWVARRRQDYDGEVRANLIRLAGIAAFYMVELMNYHGLRLGILEMPSVRNQSFHVAVTALAVVWTTLGVAVLLLLRNQVVSHRLKYLTTAADLALLTALLIVADGPRSPAVYAYFLILALAVLRFSLPLLWFATFGAMAAYLFLLGSIDWFNTRNIDVPRYHQVLFLVTLGLVGITLGQFVRSARGVAAIYAGQLTQGAAGAGSS